jgi:glutamyl-tRNA synthetase
MAITHVLRGNDHITNTFKQIILYNAMELDIPQFGHLPLILRPDKKKVSKRLGDKDVNEYQLEGILPETMINYLALLGWSPKTDREIYSVNELIKLFDINNFNTSNAVFDEEKLLAFNKEHIKQYSDHDLAVMVAPLLVDAGVTTKYWLETRWEYLRQVISILKDRVSRIPDFVELGSYFFDFNYQYDKKAEAKHFTPEAAGVLMALIESFEGLEPFSLEATEQALSNLAEGKGIKKAAIIHPTRLAVSGCPAGPGLYDILVTLGKLKVLERLKKAVDYIRNKH